MYGLVSLIEAMQTLEAIYHTNKINSYGCITIIDFPSKIDRNGQYNNASHINNHIKHNAASILDSYTCLVGLYTCTTLYTRVQSNTHTCTMLDTRVQRVYESPQQ